MQILVVLFACVSLTSRSFGRHSPGSVAHPGVVFPLLGPYPLGIATELPGTGVALAHGSGSSGARAVSSPAGESDSDAPIAVATSPSARKLWPLTSASQCGSAATMPPA